MDERENITDSYQEMDSFSAEQMIPEEDLCRKCHSRRIDRSENKNSILCTECRNVQMKYPFPKKMLPAAVIVLVLMAVAMVKTPGTIRMYKMYYQAGEQADRGDVYPALLDLQTVMEAYPSSVPVAVSMIDIAMEYGYYDAAAYTFGSYLEGKEVDDTTYSRMMRHSKRLNRYYDTVDQMDELYASLGEELGQGNLDEEAQMAALEGLREDILALTKEADLDQGLLYYYLASLSEDEGKRVEYLEASVKADPKLGFPQVELGTYWRRTGDLEGARKCYESVLENDRSNTGALRAMGILKMLEGDKEDGLLDVQKAFELNPEEEYVRETLIIALMECGREDEAKELKEQFEAEGIEFDEEFLSYLNGNVSLRDYYVG